MLHALIVGGTGLISTGITRHLLARGAKVTMYNRGLSQMVVPAGVRHVAGDRADRKAFVQAFEPERFDVVFDMICYTPEQAEDSVRAFRGRCEQFVFCSSAATYGAKVPPHVLVDEQWPLAPVCEYGRSKVACEIAFQRAADDGAFEVTIMRPGHTYGPGGAMDDQQESDSSTWDRVARGLPVLVAGDGLGLWQSTHRDDCGLLFAHAALNPKTYGQAYNATRDEVLTWRDYYREVARALDARARVVFVPARWLIAQDPERFQFLAQISQFHCAYSSAKARTDVPEFRARIGLEAGARETFADMRARGAWRDSGQDSAYQRIVERALALGFEVEEA
ncbi:MAG: NAD-dependent epimerase/dehydratase family protein [Polyangiaceae bacterium]